MRKCLRATAVFNVGGALAFAFPDSVGRLAGLPSGAPPLYRAMLALFVLLFGGAYAWLARSAVIDRPLVVFAAIGKTGAFLTVLACFVFGTLPLLSVAAISGDLAFALLFMRWLRSSART